MPAVVALRQKEDRAYAVPVSPFFPDADERLIFRPIKSYADHFDQRDQSQLRSQKESLRIRKWHIVAA
jgi:hypothetical protein